MITNPKLLGYKAIADVFWEVESNSILGLAKKALEFNDVIYVACSIGENDGSIQIVDHDTDEVYQFVTEAPEKIPGVHKTTISIMILVLKDVYHWRIPKDIFTSDNLNIIKTIKENTAGSTAF